MTSETEKWLSENRGRMIQCPLGRGGRITLHACKVYRARGENRERCLTCHTPVKIGREWTEERMIDIGSGPKKPYKTGICSQCNDGKEKRILGKGMCPKHYMADLKARKKKEEEQMFQQAEKASIEQRKEEKFDSAAVEVPAAKETKKQPKGTGAYASCRVCKKHRYIKGRGMCTKCLRAWHHERKGMVQGGRPEGVLEIDLSRYPDLLNTVYKMAVRDM